MFLPSAFIIDLFLKHSHSLSAHFEKAFWLFNSMSLGPTVETHTNEKLKKHF